METRVTIREADDGGYIVETSEEKPQPKGKNADMGCCPSNYESKTLTAESLESALKKAGDFLRGSSEASEYLKMPDAEFSGSMTDKKMRQLTEEDDEED